MANVSICEKCGKENGENAVYCCHCHEPLNENDPPLPLLLEFLERK